MRRFGLCNTFRAVEGKRDTLADLLLEASKEMKKLEECELYIINSADDDPDVLYVYEVWSSKEAHQASLSMEVSQTLIEKARPILAGVEKTGPFTPLGGKGIPSSSLDS
ncbi:putative quinol monooxygenase [Salibacterium halotolerans]|uniref:Quinol monooxygenase YgiN n=1 Tax=Salibacterium halotolerans TaxID=1884432 RepID=A0A1I5PKR0_9BACI|nr:antibiotic biosynthesis monooxygenase [Salibacterium halotolerans]SFP34101.1 Quinol monooxygenase YgiN [Salibacterium halotolerans]